MRPVNHWYGHSEALRQYANVPSPIPPPIWGYLQHGYNIEEGASYPHMLQWMPKLVWNSRNAAVARKKGLGNIVPIGAPFLYFLAINGLLDSPSAAVSPKEDVTLVYLTHSGFENSVVGDHATYAETIRERESGRVLVSVHWMDCDRREVLTHYEKAGFELIPGSHRSDRMYMDEQLHKLLSARRVIADQLCTGLLYAGALGREIEIYGETFTHSRRPGWAGEIQEFKRLHMPELLRGPLGGEDARALALRELGAAHMRSSDELTHILGWSGVRWHLRNQGRYAALTRRRLLKLGRLVRARAQ